MDSVDFGMFRIFFMEILVVYLINQAFAKSQMALSCGCPVENALFS